MKTLIYLGSGLRLNGADNMAQLRATVNAAVRSNVTINPIDTRGLVASPPLGDATRAVAGRHRHVLRRDRAGGASPGSSNRRTPTTRSRRTPAGARCSTTTISRSASQQAAHAVTGYYMLGYYTLDTASATAASAASTSSSRPGCRRSCPIAPDITAKRSSAGSTRADKERQLEEALKLEDPITDIPMAMEVNYFQLNRAEYFVPVSVRMPGSELARARPNGIH